MALSSQDITKEVRHLRMLCALCQKNQELKRSHIIPEFLYESLYDDKHRLHIFSAMPNEENRIEQKGLREPLLCGDCESLLSKYERYASLVLSGTAPVQSQRDGKLVIISGIDYCRFKLFQLSILWRAGVSSLPIFERVQLGPHAERLRSMILAQDPGPAELYACMMWLLTTSSGVDPAIIMQPTPVRILGKTTYKFTMGNLMWQYFVASQSPPYPFQYSVLRETGDAVMQLGNIGDMQDLGAFVQKVAKLGRAPKA